jgi:hypothetical protein
MTGQRCIRCQDVAFVLVASNARMMRQGERKTAATREDAIPAGRQADQFNMVGKPLPTSCDLGVNGKVVTTAVPRSF